MVVKKLSISLDRDLAARASTEAANQGLTLSAWLARAVDRELKVAAAQDAEAWFEAQYGAFTPEETAEAEAYLDSVGVPSRDAS